MTKQQEKVPGDPTPAGAGEGLMRIIKDQEHKLLSSAQELERTRQQLFSREEEFAGLRRQLIALETANAQWHAKLETELQNELQKQLDVIYRSTSWRITAPLRLMVRAARRLAGSRR